MALNSLGGEARQPVTAAVTLPKVMLPEIDDQAIAEEAKAAAIRIAERRVIRQGRDAWSEIKKAQSFAGWVAVGRALQIGRGIAVRASGADTGKHYSRYFYAWADENGFTGMHKGDRWAAVDLVENLSAVEQWRSTLPRKRTAAIDPSVIEYAPLATFTRTEAGA